MVLWSLEMGMWKALLVDDEETVRTLLATVLEQTDFSVQRAESAASAVRLLQSEDFDVVITDLRMETPLAGYEVCRFCHQLKPSPLVVILTAYPVPTSDWQSAGADVLFTKGLSIIKFATTIRELLEVRHATPEQSGACHASPHDRSHH